MPEKFRKGRSAFDVNRYRYETGEDLNRDIDERKRVSPSPGGATFGGNVDEKRTPGTPATGGMTDERTGGDKGRS
ncbi:MAG: hypothetical protein HPY55_14575 [Firmicutes bacterium]|nr:hypothetical protein [Bacillota bacterium]